MKTKQQNKQENKNIGNTNLVKELLSRSEQLSGNSQTTTAKTPEKIQIPETDQTLNSQPSTLNKAARPYVNFEERDRNRELPVDRVLEILRRWMPRQYELAEVVGKWIWITFPEQPVERVRADLSQLGFHWNNTRKCWQHPCGQTMPRGQQEPREKYTSFFPADMNAVDAANPHLYNGPARTAEQVTA
jgi:hypothetical protein